MFDNMLLVVFSVTLAMPQFGGVWTAAPTNKRMAPRAIRARPGQFLLSPKPAPGRRGSRVPAAAVAERDLLPLSCARQIGGPATRSTPLTTSTAPSQNMISILASRRSPGKLGRSYPSSRPCMLTIKQQTAARGSSTSPQAGQKPLPLSERSQIKARAAPAPMVTVSREREALKPASGVDAAAPVSTSF
jgi:hypothetical protein